MTLFSFFRTVIIPLKKLWAVNDQFSFFIRTKFFICGRINNTCIHIKRRNTKALQFWPLWWIEVRRSEEHTSELQSRFDLVCRLLLEKKKKCGGVTNHKPPLVQRVTVRSSDTAPTSN